MKPYRERDDAMQTNLPTPVLVEEIQAEMIEFSQQDDVMSGSIRMQNSDVLVNLGEKLQHLPLLEHEQLAALISELVDLFPDTPWRTTQVLHDVDVGDAHAIKQHLYWLNPVKLEAMKKEVEYIYANPRHH